MHLVEKLRDLLHLIDDYLMDRAGRGESLLEAVSFRR
jgi:hypothetical protein